ncbi:MFS transporter [Paraburkholderia sp.]|uniref:MFS transporter n=1 Tax=Paraburkholderia sp. TaxID=1926495 RepID=UPI003C7D6A1B
MNTFHPRLGRIERLSVLAVAPLGWLSFLGLPYELTTITSGFGASESTAGWIVSAELLMLTAFAVLAGRSIEAQDKRILTLAGVVLAIVGATISILFDSLPMFIFARLIIGAGLGIVTAATNALPAMFSQPEKTYAQIVMTIALMFAALMYLVPAVIALTGPKGFEIVELLTLVILGGLSFGLPRAKLKPTSMTSVTSLERMPRGVIYVLVSIFALFASQAVSWTFSEAAAHIVHLSDKEITTTFTVLALSQMPAAMLAAALGMRLGYRLPLTISLLLLVAACLGIYNIPSRWTFIPSAIAVSAIAAFTFPYLQALIAELDDSGRSAAVGGAVVNLGAAAGPAIGGVFYALGGLPFVGLTAAGLVAVCLGLALGAVRHRKEARHMALV